MGCYASKTIVEKLEATPASSLEKHQYSEKFIIDTERSQEKPQIHLPNTIPVEDEENDVRVTIASNWTVSSALIVTDSKTSPNPSLDLIRAAKEGNLESVKVSLLNGEDINKRGMWNSTPLIYACQYGHTDVAEFLIQSGADCTLWNEKFVTPLLLACIESLDSIVQLILEKIGRKEQVAGIVYNPYTDVKSCSTPLLAACTIGNATIVEMLISMGGASVNNIQNENSQKKNAEVQSMAMEYQLNSKCEAIVVGIYPIHVAAKYGHVQVIKKLVEHGVHLLVMDSNGDTPLLLSSRNLHEPAAIELVQQQRLHPIHDYRQDQINAYFVACKTGLVRLCEELLQVVPVDTQDSDGQSGLALACENGYTELVQLFLRCNANILIRDKHGLLPYDYAFERNHSEIMSYLQNSLPVELQNSLPVEIQNGLSVERESFPVELQNSVPVELQESLPVELPSSLPVECSSEFHDAI